LDIGAHDVFEAGARLPGKVDAVIDSVGEATLDHSIRSARPGGRVVLCGATSGGSANVVLARVYFTQVDVLGSTMGNRRELQELLNFLVATGARPIIDSTFPLSRTAEGVQRMVEGSLFGKVVLTT
jgi:NADPH:quinone reductase-like Zn-dependent oxidoreductase